MTEERKIGRSSEILDRMREALSLRSDAELAQHLGVSKTTLSSWRTRNKVPYEQCIKVSTDMEIDVEWLLTGDGVLLPGYKPFVFGVDNIDVDVLELAIRRAEKQVWNDLEHRQKTEVIAEHYDFFRLLLEKLTDGQRMPRDAALTAMRQSI